jgi:plasmid stabilization system protein ParE
MTVAISFHEAAEIELTEAAGYYERECPGLGVTFLDDVQAALKTLTQFPEGSPLLRGRIRRKVLLRFPYTLMYSVRDGQIRILAVAPVKRRPFYWHGRK